MFIETNRTAAEPLLMDQLGLLPNVKVSSMRFLVLLADSVNHQLDLWHAKYPSNYGIANDPKYYQEYVACLRMREGIPALERLAECGMLTADQCRLVEAQLRRLDFYDRAGSEMPASMYDTCVTANPYRLAALSGFITIHKS